MCRDEMKVVFVSTVRLLRHKTVDDQLIGIG